MKIRVQIALLSLILGSCYGAQHQLVQESSNNVSKDQESRRMGAEDWYYSFIEAVYMQWEQEVEDLLKVYLVDSDGKEFKADPNVQHTMHLAHCFADEMEAPILFAAVRLGNVRIVRALLNAGACLTAVAKESFPRPIPRGFSVQTHRYWMILNFTKKNTVQVLSVIREYVLKKIKEEVHKTFMENINGDLAEVINSYIDDEALVKANLFDCNGISF